MTTNHCGSVPPLSTSLLRRSAENAASSSAASAAATELGSPSLSSHFAFLNNNSIDLYCFFFDCKTNKKSLSHSELLNKYHRIDEYRTEVCKSFDNNTGMS
jgi:hypothetical protein